MPPPIHPREINGAIVGFNSAISHENNPTKLPTPDPRSATGIGYSSKCFILFTPSQNPRNLPEPYANCSLRKNANTLHLNVDIYTSTYKNNVSILLRISHCQM